MSRSLSEWAAAFGLLLIFVCTGGCERSGDPAAFRYRGGTMGTTFSVVTTSLPENLERQVLQDEIDQALESANALMSTYRPESQLSRFNQSKSGAWFPVSSRVATVVSTAMAVSQQTGGAYDVTIGPLVNLWGFGPDIHMPHAPNDSDISRALAESGVRFLKVRETPPALMKLQDSLYVDLSSLAKGYGVDWLAEILESHGIQNYLVEVGGEIRARGLNPDGISWRIAIEKPLAGERSVQKIVSLGSGAIATSGDYRNFFEEGGQHYSHTIDARTGYPVRHRLASVSVFSHTAMKADAQATALMVMGPEEGFRLAEQLGWAAYFIYKQDSGEFGEKMTAGFPLEQE